MTLDWTPHLTVAAVIAVEQRFLLVEEASDGLVVINQPAGHVQAGETLLAAVVRETLEETGWHFLPQALVGIYYYTSPLTQITYLRLGFSGAVSHVDPHRSLDQGILRTLWLTHAEVKARTNLRSPMVLQGIEDYLAGVRYPLTLLTHL